MQKKPLAIYWVISTPTGTWSKCRTKLKGSQSTVSYRKLNLTLQGSTALLKAAARHQPIPIHQVCSCHVWTLCRLIQFPNPNINFGVDTCSNKTNESHLPFPSSKGLNPRMVLLSSKGHVLHLTTSLIKKQTKGRRKTTCLVSEAFCKRSWSRGETQKDFDLKWSWRIWNREPHTCALRRTELKNWDQFPGNAWLTEDQDLSPDKWTSSS